MRSDLTFHDFYRTLSNGLLFSRTQCSVLTSTARSYFKLVTSLSSCLCRWQNQHLLNMQPIHLEFPGVHNWISKITLPDSLMNIAAN